MLETEKYIEADQKYNWVIDNTTKPEDTLACYNGLAISAWERGQSDSAKLILRSTIQIIDTLRTRLPLPEMRTGFLSDKLNAYHLITRIFIDEFLTHHETQIIDSILKYTEAGKARALLDIIYGDKHETMTTTESLLRDTIAHVDDSLLMGIGDSLLLSERLRFLSNSLHDLQIQSSSTYTNRSSVNYSELNQELVTKCLGPNQLTLIYLISKYGCYILSISESRIALDEIQATPDQLDTLVSEYAQVIGKYPDQHSTKQYVDSLSVKLGSILLPPDLLLNKKNRQIIIVPSGILHRLPFEALITQDDAYLIETNDVSYAYSLASHLSLSSRSHVTPDINLLAVGDPEYNDSSIIPLPYSGEEIRRLGELFEPTTVRIITGAQSTSDLFAEYKNKSLKYIHVATHAIVNDRYPDRSALILAPDKANDDLRLLRTESKKMILIK